jgi:uncharacterized membrane protein
MPAEMVQVCSTPEWKEQRLAQTDARPDRGGTVKASREGIYERRKMTEENSLETTPLERAQDALLGSGRGVFSLAIMALGMETLVCARTVCDSPPFSPRYKVIPVIPWLPAIPSLAYAFGAILVVFGAGLLSKRTVRTAALVLGSLLFLCALIFDVPKNIANIGNMSLRTSVFEPLAIASIVWLLPGPGRTPSWLAYGSRYLLGVSLIVFGVDHLIALAPIATLIPAWIPWHAFWIAFFGIGLIAAGLSISRKLLERWGATCLGLMFGIWVFTLHLPRVLGLYGIPGAPHNPNEWSSLFIAIALWGGPWALARRFKKSLRKDIGENDRSFASF